MKKTKEKRKRAGTYLKRLLAGVLVVTMLMQVQTGSVLWEAVQAVMGAVNEVDAGLTVDDLSYNDIYMFPVWSNDLWYQREKGDMVAYDYLYIERKDIGDTNRYGEKITSTLVGNYCHTYGMPATKIQERENEFLEEIEAMNDVLDKYRRTANSKIYYEKKSMANSSGKSIVNNFNSNRGTAVTTGTVDMTNMPTMLTMTGSATYTKTLDVTNQAQNNKSFDYEITMNAQQLPKGKIKVTLSNKGKRIAQQMLNNSGAKLTMSGSLVSRNLRATDGKYNLEVKIETTDNNSATVNLTNLVFSVSGGTTELANIYMTSQPLPADVQEAYIAENGNPAERATYSSGDSMYVVMQFTGSVRLNKKTYYDYAVYAESLYPQYYKAYPRLALSVTDASGVEQNNKVALYADYFGTMSGLDSEGNVVEDNCLIFKVDISGWEDRDFTIASLSPQITQGLRTGNMEWIYDLPAKTSYDLIKSTYSKWSADSSKRLSKSAIQDANGKQITVAEGVVFDTVTVTNEKGQQEEVVPTYCGAIPSIREVVITAESGKEYVKAGDTVNVNVVFSSMMDESLPTPTFYLNDYDINSEAVPGTEEWTGTVVSNGVYGDTRMVPLMATWTIKEEDTNNVWTISEDIDETEVDNHTGAATLSITGTDDVEGSTVYYKIDDESSVALQKGDTFDPTGWTVYRGDTYIKNLPTVIYKTKAQEDGSQLLERAIAGGFVKVCQVVQKEVTDEEGNTTEQLVVHKYGESDEINTQSDSEEAMVQENTPIGTVISYSVQVKADTEVERLYLVTKKDSYKDHYFYDGEQRGTTLLLEGEMRNVYGKELPEENNFGTYDSEGKFNRNGVQYSYVGVEKSIPIISSYISSETGEDTPEKTGVFTFSDKINWKQHMENTQNNIRSVTPVGVEKYVVEIGPTDANVLVTIEGEEYTLEAGKTKKITKWVSTAEKESKRVEITAELIPAENGTYNEVELPVSMTVYDYAGNTATSQLTYKMGMPYAEFSLSQGYVEPVAMEYVQDEYLETKGRLWVQINTETKSTKFDKLYYKIAILPTGEEPDEDTVWYSYNYNEELIQVEDDNGNIVEVELTGYRDNLSLIFLDLPVRGCKLNKTVYVTYETPEGNCYSYTDYVENQENEEENGKAVQKQYKTCELSYDTTDVAPAIDLNMTEEYTVHTVEQSTNPEESVTIELVDGQLVNGKLKRKNYYQFHIVTDEFTKVDCSFSTNWNGGKYISKTIEPGSDVILDTRELGVAFGADTPFGGSAWLENWRANFIPVTSEKHTYTTYTCQYDTEGNLVSKEVKETRTYNEYSDILNNKVQEYKINVLDEMFVERSEEYWDILNTTGSVYGNKIFLEMDLTYNSLNGYNDIYGYGVDRRDMVYSSELYEKTTMVFADDVSEYLQPETDIDFANSWIYIYKMKNVSEDETPDWVKDGDYVRKIPLPANIYEVTYNAAKEGYSPYYVTALGFEVDLNAYVTSMVTDEDGNEIQQYGMPEEGCYGAYVEIATWLQDENGEQIVISSEHYSKNVLSYNPETGEEEVEYIKEEIPEVIFAYDYTEPEGSLYLTEEVLDYMKVLAEGVEGNAYGQYDLGGVFSDAQLMQEINSKDYKVIKAGDTLQLYLANPTLELGGTYLYDGEDCYGYSLYAENGDSYNRNRNCEIKYAFVPTDSFDSYGNIKADVIDEIEWLDAWNENEVYDKSMNLTVPADLTESCYVVVKFADNAGNETSIYKKRVIIDNEAPTAKLYQYTKSGTNYVQLLQLTDNYWKNSEIYITNDNGTEYKIGEVLASTFVAEIAEDAEYTVTISDKAGNAVTLSLEENGIRFVAPTVEVSSADEAVAATLRMDTSEEDMDTSVSELEVSDDLQELTYDTNETTGNGYLEFTVAPESGSEIYVDYAWSSDSYKKIYQITDDADYSKMWNTVGNGSDTSAYSMVNAAVSSQPNAAGEYTVRASILLPGNSEDTNYVLTFRFRNNVGLCSYYTVGYKVTGTEGVLGELVESTTAGNKQVVNFSEPVRLISPVYGDSAKTYKKSTEIYCDANGDYELLVKDLRGNEYTMTVTYSGKPFYAPDINYLNDGQTVSLDLDMGYNSGWAMTFDTTEGEGYFVAPSEEEGRTVTYGEGENAKNGYLYAAAEVTKNTSFTIGLIGTDGVSTDTYTYSVGSFISDDLDYTITYSRTSAETTSDNCSTPVEAVLTVPEGTEILSTDGAVHTFYKNGSYHFEVKTAEGKVKELVARVDWIVEPEADGTDETAPIYSVSKYIKSEGELIDITGADTEDTKTRAEVQVKVWALDINVETLELNPVTMTVTSDNGNVTQSTEDEYVLNFTENDVAHVVLRDPTGNTTEFDITVDNIDKSIAVTGTVRYVRYGLTETRAYISLPEGVTLRSLEGIQTETRSDGSTEYYHLFTQNGRFIFQLAGENGNTADVVTKYVNVFREPLILTRTSANPEEPDWGEAQVINVSANQNLLSVYLTDLEGNSVDDMEVAVDNKKIAVKFEDNRTVICHAVTSNGSQAEITLSTDKIRIDNEKPELTYSVSGTDADKTRKVELTVTDTVLEKYVTDDTNLTFHIEGEIAEYAEENLEKVTVSGNTTLTKKASFTVNQPGTYQVYVYDMQGNYAVEEIEINLDNEAPVLENHSVELTERAGSHTLVFTIANEPGTITCKGMPYKVSTAGEEVAIPISKNGTYEVTATDLAGNVTKTKVEIMGLDDTAPVITTSEAGYLTYSSKTFASEEELTEAILENVSAVDDSGEEVTLTVSYKDTVDVSAPGTIFATVKAADPYGNTAKVNIYVKLIRNEVINHSELNVLAVNGKRMQAGGIVTTTSKTLKLENVPEGAVISYAQGKYTGAQMKYKANAVEGTEITVTEKGTYTIMLKLSDYSIHIYYVAVN